MRKESDGIRWDKVVGIITIITMLVFSVMIYIDHRPKNDIQASAGQADATVDTEASSETVTTKAGLTTVCIDAGHGGSDNGVESGGVYEKTQTLQIALKVKTALEKQNISVVMTRTSDVSLSEEERVKICNDAGATAMISIHRNYNYGTGTAYGAEAWVHSSAQANSISLGKNILTKLNSEVDEDNRGVKYGTIEDTSANYYINTKSKCASCILELGFMNSSYDEALVTTKSDATAKAIADGIVQYLKTQGYING